MLGQVSFGPVRPLFAKPCHGEHGAKPFAGVPRLSKKDGLAVIRLARSSDHGPALRQCSRRPLGLFVRASTALDQRQVTDTRTSPIKTFLNNIPLLPASLLLLGNAFLTRDALLLASFFGLLVALPIRKLRNMGLTPYNALAASSILVFFAWSTFTRLLPARHLQAVDVQSCFTFPLPKLLIHWTNSLATITSSRADAASALRLPTMLPCLLLAGFVSLNLLILPILGRKGRSANMKHGQRALPAGLGGKKVIQGSDSGATKDLKLQDLKASLQKDAVKPVAALKTAAQEAAGSINKKLGSLPSLDKQNQAVNKGLEGPKTPQQIEQQKVHASNSTASSGLTYKRPGFMVEKANFKGPSKASASPTEADKASGKEAPQGKMAWKGGSSADRPFDAETASKEVSKSGAAQSNSGNAIDPKLVHHMQAAVPPKGYPTRVEGKAASPGKEEMEEKGLGMKGLFNVFQPKPPQSKEGSEASESLDVKALLKRVTQLEQRQTAAISEAELKDLKEKLNAHSVMDVNAKLGQARKEMAQDRESARRHAAGVKQMEVKAAEMRQSLEDLKSKLGHMQEDHKKVKSQVEKSASSQGSSDMESMRGEIEKARKALSQELNGKLKELQGTNGQGSAPKMLKDVEAKMMILERKAEKAEKAALAAEKQTSAAQAFSKVSADGRVHAVREELTKARSAWTGDIAKLRQEVQAAHSELDKAQTRVSCVLEDMISHMHSPKFAKRVTADYSSALAELEKDVNQLKTRTGLPLEAMKTSTTATKVTPAAGSIKPPQAGPSKPSETFEDGFEVNVEEVL